MYLQRNSDILNVFSKIFSCISCIYTGINTQKNQFFNSLSSSKNRKQISASTKCVKASSIHIKKRDITQL